ncbi:MAG: hypothetical protein DRQ56_05890 [Gammaproteobacteria bacterium]|nr:MAG: hypothetical protein DRQ56_05890 [Gammaproteobacteria bacterium]
MNLFALILYGAVNVLMVSYYLLEHGRFYQFPFWAGVIALGWFFPQAIGGYLNVSEFPENAYVDGMLFATLCMIALWVGFEGTVHKNPVVRRSWLGAPFNSNRLYWVAVIFCLFGFFFQWKLWSLPEEILAESQPSGVVVKYLFFGNIFKFGFIALWLLYLSQIRVLVPKMLIFIVPSLCLFIEAALLRGRRAGMMDLVSYLIVSLWFVRRIAVPRWFIIVGLSFGLVLINGIRTYRLILMDKDTPWSERLSEAARADYLEASKRNMDKSGSEFKNYIFYRKIHDDLGIYDWGTSHWNRFVHNYVPAQITGREFKESLMLKPTDIEIKEMIKIEYGHVVKRGTTTTGYKDAFASFGWFGFVKFLLIGWIMGVLYRSAMQGAFLGQLLYIYVLTKGMQSVSHGTNDILVRVWIYFFTLGFPILLWARRKNFASLELEINEGRCI